MDIKRVILIGLLISLQFLEGKSLSFQHHDWQVVCDNAHTCRIAGYSSDNAKYSVSVLITREAGARKKMRGEIQLGHYGEADEKLLKKFPSIFKLQMFIDEKSYGFISMKKGELIASLSEKQTKALVTSLSKSSKIVWKYKKYHWELSDEGSTAVLLKTDTFQKRLNTRNAFYKKGIHSEKNVLKAKAIPVIYVQPVVDDKEIIIKDKAYIEKLRGELYVKDEYCFDSEYEENFTFYPLSSSKILVSRLAWRAAYNSGYCSWVANRKEPFNSKLIAEGDYYVNEKKIGSVSNSQKGRGLGDCWSYEAYVWTGKTFEQSSVGSSGLCRLIAPGGAWDLPTFVSKLNLRIK